MRSLGSAAFIRKNGKPDIVRGRAKQTHPIEKGRNMPYPHAVGFYDDDYR